MGQVSIRCKMKHNFHLTCLKVLIQFCSQTRGYQADGLNRETLWRIDTIHWSMFMAEFRVCCSETGGVSTSDLHHTVTVHNTTTCHLFCKDLQNIQILRRGDLPN